MNVSELGKLWSRIVIIIQDPTSNLSATLLLIGLAALLLLIVISLVVLFGFVIPSFMWDDEDDDEDDEDDEDDDDEDDDGESGDRVDEVRDVAPEDLAVEQPATRRWIPSITIPTPPTRAVLVLAVVIVCASSFYAFRYSSTNSFCAGACHHTALDSASDEPDAHKNVRCVSCHEPSGATGIPIAAVTRAEHVLRGLVRRDPATDPVSSENCLSCHDSILSGLTRNIETSVTMSHREVVDAGMDCWDCHHVVSHRIDTRPGMQVCLRCHDSKTASSQCSTCHDGDPAASSAEVRDFPKIIAAKRNCGGCHNQKRCDACHGLRLPHSEEFVQWGHAKQAVFARKESCKKCHKGLVDCMRCHDSFDRSHNGERSETASHHASIYPRTLWTQPIVRCYCHGARLYRNFCALCHEEAEPLFSEESTPTSATP